MPLFDDGKNIRQSAKAIRFYVCKPFSVIDGRRRCNRAQTQHQERCQFRYSTRQKSVALNGQVNINRPATYSHAVTDAFHGNIIIILLQETGVAIMFNTCINYRRWKMKKRFIFEWSGFSVRRPLNSIKWAQNQFYYQFSICTEFRLARGKRTPILINSSQFISPMWSYEKMGTIELNALAQRMRRCCRQSNWLRECSLDQMKLVLDKCLCHHVLMWVDRATPRHLYAHWTHIRHFQWTPS